MTDDATALIADILAEHFSGVRLPAGEFDNAAIEAIAVDVQHRLDRAGMLMPDLARRVATGEIMRRALAEASALAILDHETRLIEQGKAMGRLEIINERKTGG